MRLIFRSLMYVAAFIVPIVLTGTIGLITSVRTATPRPADADAVAASIIPPPAPPYDANKPTVAVLLGSDVHEITDPIGPYATFKESGLYNSLTITHDPDGSTTLAGPVRDQSALYGLIDKARDLGLTLLAVERSAPPGLADEPLA